MMSHSTSHQATNMSNSDHQRLDQCHILHLNDDCFYKIYEFLSKDDWCSLRGTCTRFRTISDYLFERKCKSFDFVIGNGLPFDTSVINAKHLIRSFGHFLTELTISLHYFHYDNDTSQLVPFVHRYCHSLKSLELNLVDLHTVTIIHCRQLFSNLHRLVIRYWDNEESFNCCLLQCVSLKELEIHGIRNITGKCLARRYEYLESFTMEECKSISSVFVEQFLAKNRQLTKVNIWCCYFKRTLESYMALPDASTFSWQYQYLPDVAFLRTSKLRLSSEAVEDAIINQYLPFLTIHNHIEDLHLYAFRLNDELVHILCRMKTLKKLTLTATRRLSGDCLEFIACELPALSEIHIYDCILTSCNGIKGFVAEIETTQIGFDCVFRRNLAKETKSGNLMKPRNGI